MVHSRCATLLFLSFDFQHSTPLGSKPAAPPPSHLDTPTLHHTWLRNWCLRTRPRVSYALTTAVLPARHKSHPPVQTPLAAYAIRAPPLPDGLGLVQTALGATLK
ncbi:hypothetical protein JX266_009409 [Neoarthrinium moseri]|nr:hypothetical protein JX266_009409 [Neoarthrinium moseri]